MNLSAHQSFAMEDVIQQLRCGSSMPAEVHAIFREEADEHLRAIYDGLERLKHASQDKQALATVRRTAHTFKGAAGAVGMIAATRLAHRMEDLLDVLANSGVTASEGQLNLLLATADQLQGLTSGAFDVESFAVQTLDLYRRFELELGARVRSSAADVGHLEVCTDAANSELPHRFEDSLEPSTIGSPVACIRVPLDRLDDLGSLLGEMIVNQFEFQHRMDDFESRIEELQSAIDSLRSVGGCAEFQPGQFEGLGLAHHDFAAGLPFAGVSNSRFAPLAAGLREIGNALNPTGPRGFDPLEFEQFDQFSLSTQALAEADKDAEIMCGKFRTLRASFDLLSRRQQHLIRSTQKGLLRIRMVPLKAIKSRLERTIRTVSAKLGRKVAFEMVGEAVELDKTVLDAITDPILHLMRNAIDHGVEMPDVRDAAGKPELAMVRLEAVHEGTRVRLRLSDDGAGINSERVRQKAILLGLVGADQELGPDELNSLIFVPGFSTASHVTEVSGRGVGMDVVGDAIKRLKGSIRVDSRLGAGTTFTIDLPTKLGIIRALLVETEGRTFAIPMAVVQEIRQLNPESISHTGDRSSIRHHDRDIRLVHLGSCLGISRKGTQRLDRAVPIVVVEHGPEQFAVRVDAISSCREIVVKSLGSHLRNVPGISGATLGGDGTVIPILEVMSLTQPGFSGRQIAVGHETKSSEIVPSKFAMVIDDSISIRQVTDNLLRTAGWDTVLAKNGVDALEKLAALETPPDIFLCDMEMPRMDGLELIRRIREQPEFEWTPIVMITSRASEKHRHQAFDAGATEYVVKPFNDEQLLNCIDQLVQAHRQTVSY